MIGRLRLLVCLLLVLAVSAAVFAGTLSAQVGVADQLDRLVKLSATKGPADSWMLAAKLRALGPEVADKLPPLLDGSGPTFRIAAANTLIFFGQDEAGARALLTLITDEARNSATRRAAAQMLAAPGRRTAETALARLTVGPDKKTVADTLLAQMQNALDPMLKLQLAKTLWRISLNHRRKAKDLLRGYLKSEDTDLQAAGALALAEFDDFEAAKEVLERLKDEPTRRGELARSYLRTMETFRQSDDAFYRRPRGGSDGAKFKLLEEVLLYIKLYHLTGDKHEDNELLETAARSVLRAMDPMSTFLTAERRAVVERNAAAHLADVGAYLDYDGRGIYSVVRVFRPGAAWAAGLRADDKIVEVDGWSTFDRDREEVLRRVNGPAGSTVKLKVVRRGWREPRTLELQRAPITPPLVAGQMLPAGIGYVAIQGFAKRTARELDQVLARLGAGKARALVLDLRDNVGGDVDAAAAVAGRFLPVGKLVVYWEGRNRFLAPRQEVRTHHATPLDLTPIVVLVDRRTGAAAEIVAGALAFHGRAVVVGRPTLARGSVQRVLELRSQPGDRFTDLAEKNDRFDPGEPFTDVNKNGVRDPEEPFEDLARKNGEWDPGEPYEDVNENGRYDRGPAVRITIARHALADGTQIQRLLDREGKVIQKGGVTPAVKVELTLWPGWKEEELDKLLEAGAFRRYLERHGRTDRDTLFALAAFDGRDPQRYPGFDAFVKAADTHLEPQDVRRWLRVQVREWVERNGGPKFPSLHSRGDYVDDPDLQQAVREALSRLQPPVDPKSVPEYAVMPEPEKKEEVAKDKVAKDKVEEDEEQ